MLGKCYVAFVRHFIDILAEHHANSKMQILRVSTDEDYRDLQAKLVNAAHRMKRDGWWLPAAEHPAREKTMQVRLMKEMLGSLVQAPKTLPFIRR
jgi:hypothetical protein